MHNFVTALYFLCIILSKKYVQNSWHFYLFLFCSLRCKRMFCALNTSENNGAVKNSLLLNCCLNTLPKEHLLLRSHITYKKFCSRYFNILCNSGTKWHCCPWVIVALRYALGNNHTCCSLNTEENYCIEKIFSTHLFLCHCLFVVKFTLFSMS